MADAEQIAVTLLRRFELAMIRGRAFHARGFRAHVLGHPLVVHLARRLVWKDDRATFRVAEDGTLASERDAEHALADDARVSVPHPLALAPDTLAAWVRIFSDYAIAQPFEQLGRPTFTLTPGELAATTLARADGKTTRAGPLLGSLESRGWQKDGGTYLAAYTKSVRTRSGGEALATLSFGPGIDLGDVSGSPEQKLGTVRLVGAASWAEIEPIDVCELVRDLDRI
jgi:hypothetical protein